MNYKDFQAEIRGLNSLLNLTEDSIRVYPVKPSRGHIEIKLSPLTGTIDINIDENWQIGKDSLLCSYLSKGYHEHPLLEMGRDLLFHNFAHSQICPASFEVHHKLMNVVAKALKEKGKSSYTGYVCHAFEDIVVNSWCKLNLPHFKGMVIFFYDQLASSRESFSGKNFLKKFARAFNTGPRISSFYEIFIQVNLSLWGEEDDFYLLKKFFTQKKEVEDAKTRIINLFGLKDSVELQDTVEVLSDSSRWEIFAREFSLLVADFLEEEKKIELSCENFFEKQITENRNVRKKIVRRMYEKSKEKPDYIESIEVTKTLYEMLAPEIPIQVATEKKGRAFPVVPFDFEPFDPQIHSREDIDLGGVLVDAESPFLPLINFRVPRYHYDISIPYRSERKGAFPDICFLIDTSASMADDVENKIAIPTVSMIRQMIRSRFYFGEGKCSWSDKSKYHHVLLGFNGAIKWLTSQGIAPYIHYNVITFSRNTLTSGWREYYELDECKKIAYLPQFDTTIIDHRVIESQLLKKKEPFILIILSDGEIFNWDESTKAYSPHRLRDFIRGVKPVKPLFRKIVEKNMVSHIQISEGDFKPRISTLTCRDLAQWGAEIYRVNDINTLESLMIKITGKIMSPYLQDLYEG
ncbi:MAG TPA: hypothetical protein ENL39_00620 [Candidatus Aerophobetes bacterium]|uniref:VWA domain-containing protein n=1 Tax=Aerophobetes bacterium TaxID=2030807 RepID=A0A7V5LZN0_UNCAE|nr:hypothetical protein [Candidatus Aerophobetes bacterium]